MKAIDFKCEYKINPLGIDEANPRLGWIIESQGRGQKQTAYQIHVATSRDLLEAEKADLWDSGKINSDQMNQIEYKGEQLSSEMQCFWRVRLWDKDQKAGAWSDISQWQMGILNKDDWKATWITGKDDVQYLRKSFKCEKEVKRATLYATALGIYELNLGGRRVGDYVFAPGWTDYTKRIYYHAFDVTDQLTKGNNTLAAIVTPGWACGHIAFDFKRNYCGSQPMFLCQLNIEFTDGSKQSVITDESWRSSSGPIRMSDLLHGEEYDARLEMVGWLTKEFDDSNWENVNICIPNVGLLRSHPGLPIRELMELPSKNITEPHPGRYVFDLGQNMVGYIRLKLRGCSKGRRLMIRYGEMLNADGSVYTGNLRHAQATDIYYMRGSDVEEWQPKFTYHGFRYVELLGYPSCLIDKSVNEPSLDTVTGIVVGSYLEQTGEFECSHPKINQLVSNIRWGQRGNYFDIPTDCPQRDERMGWSGDAQVFIRTGSYLADVAVFFKKWLWDVEDAQLADGAVTNVAPHLDGVGQGIAGWGDAAVICPWIVYQVYNDTRILEQHYSMMQRWIEYCAKRSDEPAQRKNDFGDWLSIDADTPKDLLATAYFAYSTNIVSRIADVLGKKDDAQKYARMFNETKALFIKKYVEQNGKVAGDTQTGYLLALHMDLLPDDKIEKAIKHLVADIEKRGNRLSTGFLGISFLNPTLSRIGRTDLAYKLLHQEQFPSWLYEVNQGATTIWERWDSWTHEKGFQSTGMNSFNHYSFGSVGQWLFANVAGIDLVSQGFKHIMLKPETGFGLNFAKASYKSISGLIRSEWEFESDNRWRWSVEVPSNTIATVRIPFGRVEDICEGGRPICEVPDIRFIEKHSDICVFEIGSGKYEFMVKNVSAI